MELEIVKQILASDILNWFLAFMGGIAVFAIVDKMQTNIERHSVIKDIEDVINSLFNKTIAMERCAEEVNEANKYKFEKIIIRTVLDDKLFWEECDREGPKKEALIITEEAQRYVRIRSDKDCTQYISTQALHESLILFRRIEKLYKDGIVKQIDLADLWREILPFGISGRLLFFSTYFAMDDIGSMVFVIYNTVLACEKYKIEKAIEYFRVGYQKEEEVVKGYYEYRNNNRYRLAERCKMTKFKRIVE